MLILTSGIALAMTFLGLVPRKVQALGLSFEPFEQRYLVVGSVVVVAYFLISFWSVARLEMAAWLASKRLGISDASVSVENAQRAYEVIQERDPEIREASTEAGFQTSAGAELPIPWDLQRGGGRAEQTEERIDSALARARLNERTDYHFPLVLGIGTIVAVVIRLGWQIWSGQ